MKTTFVKAIALLPVATTAFAPLSFRSRTAGVSPLQGYLDDLSRELYAPDPDAVPELETHEATDMDKSKIDRGGVGDWDGKNKKSLCVCECRRNSCFVVS